VVSPTPPNPHDGNNHDVARPPISAAIHRRCWATAQAGLDAGWLEWRPRQARRGEQPVATSRRPRGLRHAHRRNRGVASALADQPSCLCRAPLAAQVVRVASVSPPIASDHAPGCANR